jgi:hypothetical protein
MNPLIQQAGLRPDTQEWEIGVLQRFATRLVARRLAARLPATDPQKEEAGPRLPTSPHQQTPRYR